MHKSPPCMSTGGLKVIPIYQAWTNVDPLYPFSPKAWCSRNMISHASVTRVSRPGTHLTAAKELDPEMPMQQARNNTNLHRHFTTPPKIPGGVPKIKNFRLALLDHTPRLYTAGQVTEYIYIDVGCQTRHRDMDGQLSNLRFAPALNEPLRNNNTSWKVLFILYFWQETVLLCTCFNLLLLVFFSFFSNRVWDADSQGIMPHV